MRMQRENIHNTTFWLNGKLHRANGFAVVWHAGGGSWWLFGKRHRYYGEVLHHQWWIRDNRIK